LDDIEKQRKTEEFMKILGLSIEEVINQTVGEMGFALLVFDFGRPGVSNYISNAERGDMVTALRECADRLEGGMDIPPVTLPVQ